MPLEGLPFDVFHQIAASLDDRDYINLSRTCRLLHESTKSELTARKTAEVSLVPSRTGASARLTPSTECSPSQQGRPVSLGRRNQLAQGCGTSL